MTNLSNCVSSCILALIAVTTSSPCFASAKSELAKRAIARTLERDAVRDAGLRAERLGTTRLVDRYVTREQAVVEAERGFAPGTHFTSKAARGRPLSAAAARKRFGLPTSPRLRTTVELNGDLRVKKAKALGGKAGVGELTIAQRVSPDAIRRSIPVK